MKKFEEVAMRENNPKWEKSISRLEELYSPVYGIAPMRTEFDRDYTRIINCNAYRRLKHKTQVFFAPQNDHICTRIEHVNLVDSISNTISNYLGLNTDLTKAIAVAHDIGHSPFGHQGERILSEIAEREFGEKFWHGKNGVYYVDKMEYLEDKNGEEKNLNLTYAVRDGIISHCGNPDPNGLKPRDEEVDLLNDFDKPNKYNPFTWEAAVVKVADNISYLGRDLEDAKTMKLLTEKDLNTIDQAIEKITITNSSIIGYLTNDLCENSSIDEGLKFSEEALEIMNKIKVFNSERIYKNERIQPTIRYFKVLMNELYYILKGEYNGTQTFRNIRRMKRYYPFLADEFSDWLARYTNSPEREFRLNKAVFDLNNEEEYSRAIIEYMSGMTDSYIVRMYNEITSF